MNSTDDEKDFILDYAQKCIYCGYCSLCPTFRELGWETYHPRGILEQIKSYFSQETSIESEKSLFEAVFNCTLCGACQNICLVDIPLVQIWEYIRQEAFKKGRWKTSMTVLTDNVKNKHNIFGLEPEDRLAWTDIAGINLSRRLMKEAEYAYFLGCQASYSGKMVSVSESVVKILRKARIDFTVLGPEEWCCGSPIFLGGGYQLGNSIAEHNLEKFKELNIKKIVVSCSGCYRTFKNVYPKVLGEKWDIEVLHTSELFNQLINEGKIKFVNELKEKITYKDPCELARHTGLTEAPRELIKSIPNVRYEELTSNRDSALCCGGGGLLKVNNESLVEEVNDHLIDEIAYTEADIVVNACPVCLDTISQGLKRNKVKAKAIDISELVRRLIGVKK